MIGLPGVSPLVAAGVWAVFGAGIGASIGAITHVGLSAAWEQTFEAVKAGNVAVGVHTDDEDEVELATGVIARQDPLIYNRFDD